MIAKLTTKEHTVWIEPVIKSNPTDLKDWLWCWGDREMRVDHSQSILTNKVRQIYNKRSMANGIVTIFDKKQELYKEAL